MSLVVDLCVLIAEMLPVRKCGGQGFECAAQGLGCMGMSAFYGGFDNEEAQAEAHRVFDKVAEMEGVMLDTSDIYGPKTNEELIGRQLLDRSEMTRPCSQARPSQTEETSSRLQPSVVSLWAILLDWTLLRST